ncbi:MAG: phosphatase PAP2 family protein [Syntrophales bacterium]|nr:phosphatase PAP2 family protein [Syntrophales bacterium]
MKRCRQPLLRGIVLALATIILLATHSGPAHAANQSITRAGDIFATVLPGIAVGSTFFSGNPDGAWWDREGTEEAALSIGTTAGIVAIGKEAANKLRPDGSDRNSFPSGHTASSFSGASFIGMRYGWQWGVPAYAVAAFVGYSRFQADQHYADDIMAGASVALLSTLTWVKPMHDRVVLLPMAMERGVGIQLALLENDPARKDIMETSSAAFTYPKYRFNFNFGPAFVKENKASSDGGTTFNLRDLEGHDYPLTTAVVHLDAALDERHELGFSIWPMEARDSGSFNSPVVYRGVTFPANTTIKSDWLLYDLRVRYRYEFFPSSPLILAAGAGAMLQYHIIELETADLSRKADEDDLTVVPFLHLKLGWRITEKLTLYLNGDGGKIPKNWFVDGGAYLNYRFGRHWDFTAGYQYHVRDIDPGEVQNRVVQHLPYLAVAYSW